MPGGAAAEEPPAKRLRPSPEREGAATLQNGAPTDEVEAADGMADTGSIAMADQVGQTVFVNWHCLLQY